MPVREQRRKRIYYLPATRRRSRFIRAHATQVVARTGRQSSDLMGGARPRYVVEHDERVYLD